MGRTLGLAVLALFALASSLEVHAQGQSSQTSANPCVIGPLTTSSLASSQSFDNRTKGCNFWILYVYGSGNGVSTSDTASLNGANDNSGAPGTLVSIAETQLSATSNAGFAYAPAFYFPWLTVSITKYAGSGTVTVYAIGYSGSQGCAYIVNNFISSQTCAPPLALNLGTSSATGAFTTVDAAELGIKGTLDLFVTYSGITGSPSGCSIQPQVDADASHHFNYGSAVVVTPANGTSVPIAGLAEEGINIQFVYSCRTYPTAGTVLAYIIFH